MGNRAPFVFYIFHTPSVIQLHFVCYFPYIRGIQLH
jgi:hypothetical protein